MQPAKLIRPDQGTWLSFHGIPTQLLARGSDTSGSYALSRGVSISRSITPPHVHSFDESFYLLSGELTFVLGNQRIIARAGDLVHIRGGTAHQPINHTGADAEVLIFTGPSGFDEFQLAISEPAPGPDGPFAPPSPDVAERLAAAAPKYGIDLHPAPELFQREPEYTLCRAGEGRSIAAVGDIYRFMVTSGDTGGRYTIWHARVFPGGGPPPHIHLREEEAFYVLSGTLTAWDDGVRTEAGPGSLLILPRGGRHWFKNETSETVEMLILIAPAGGEEFFFRFGHPWAEPDRAPDVSPEEIGRLLALAPEYGIVLDPHP